MELNLKKSVLLGDGALGTQLQKLSGKADVLPESFNLTEAGREMVGKVHEEYIRAGAQIIETNTFAANLSRLERFGLGNEFKEINAQGVAIARRASAGRVLVAGSVGPLDLGPGVKDAPADVLEGYFKSHVAALERGGVDLLMLETFASPFEARLALSVASGTGLPVFFLMGGQTIARPYARKAVMEMISMAHEFKVSALGVNCVGPYDLGMALNILSENTDLPLLAYPNAGIPSIERGMVKYDLPVAALLGEARKWLEKGVVVFGGCCGTAPEHIRALAETFKGKSPCLRAGAMLSGDRAGVSVRTYELQKPGGAGLSSPVMDGKTTSASNPIRARFGSGKKPLIAVEVKPALSRSLDATVDSVEKLAGCGVDFFSVPDNPAANPNRDCMACAHLLQKKYNIPAIMHKTATQTNALHTTSYLLGAFDLGLRGILAVSGDSPGAGAFDRIAGRVNDLRNSIELLRLISLLREGMLVNGQSLPYPADFASGCAFAHSANLKTQLAWLSKKVEAGAEFLFTQPVFSTEDYLRAQDALAKFSMKKFIGILPLVSGRQAKAIQSGRIPGITVPQAVVDRLSGYPGLEDQFQAGMELAFSLVSEVSRAADGIYLIMPFHKEAAVLTSRLIGAARG